MSSGEYSALLSEAGVSRETFDRLKLYQELLLKWQSKINLIGPDTVADVWKRHFVDSLQLLLRKPDLSGICVDMGSGAGFPGMVLAIAGAGNMHLIESDGKKIIFLKEVARITKTPVTIHHKRIEECELDHVDVILARACSSLSDLFMLSEKYVSRETVCYFHKGKNYPKELLDAKREWLFDYVVIPSVTDTQGAILEVRNLTTKR